MLPFQFSEFMAGEGELQLVFVHVVEEVVVFVVVGEVRNVIPSFQMLEFVHVVEERSLCCR